MAAEAVQTFRGLGIGDGRGETRVHAVFPSRLGERGAITRKRASRQIRVDAQRPFAHELRLADVPVDLGQARQAGAFVARELSVPVGKRGLRMRQVLGALRLLGGATSGLLFSLDGGDALRDVARSSSRQSRRRGHGGVRSLIGQGLRRCRRTARRADLADTERLHIMGNAAGGSCESHAQATCQHARHARKADNLQRQPAGAVCIPFLQTKPFARSIRPDRQGGDSLLRLSKGFAA